MKDEIRDLVNYVIEAMKDYRQDQSAETYRLSRINQETNPASDAPETTAKKFAKINADYKEEKRLERAPRGPQTRKQKPFGRSVYDPLAITPKSEVDKAIEKLANRKTKPIDEGWKEIKQKAKEMGDEVVMTGRDVRDAIVGGKRLPKEPEKPQTIYVQRTSPNVTPKEPANQASPKTPEQYISYPDSPANAEYLRKFYPEKEPANQASPKAPTSSVSTSVSQPSSNKYGGKYHIGPPTSSGPTKRPRLQPSDAALSYEQKLKKYGYKEVPVEEGAQVPKGAKTGPVATGYELKAKQTKDPSGKKPTTPAPSAFSKSDWAARKAAMDKAIDG